MVVGSSVHVEEQTVLTLPSQRSSGHFGNPDLTVLKIQTSLKNKTAVRKIAFRARNSLFSHKGHY